MDTTTDHFTPLALRVRGKNRVRCTLTMEILDLLNEENVSGVHTGRASLKFDEKSYFECLKR